MRNSISLLTGRPSAMEFVCKGDSVLVVPEGGSPSAVVAEGKDPSDAVDEGESAVVAEGEGPSDAVDEGESAVVAEGEGPPDVVAATLSCAALMRVRRSNARGRANMAKNSRN